MQWGDLAVDAHHPRRILKQLESNSSGRRQPHHDDALFRCPSDDLKFWVLRRFGLAFLDDDLRLRLFLRNVGMVIAEWIVFIRAFEAGLAIHSLFHCVDVLCVPPRVFYEIRARQ